MCVTYIFTNKDVDTVYSPKILNMGGGIKRGSLKCIPAQISDERKRQYLLKCSFFLPKESSMGSAPITNSYD